MTSLFNDRAYQDPAEAVCQLGKSPTEEWQLQISNLVDIEDKRDLDGAEAPYWRSYRNVQFEHWRPPESDVAYLHHTSGTSTGLPKSIPQTHHAAVDVPPTFSDCHEKATFTTTPLYYGGAAD